MPGSQRLQDAKDQKRLRSQRVGRDRETEAGQSLKTGETNSAAGTAFRQGFSNLELGPLIMNH